jgi:hypothetical protein
MTKALDGLGIEGCPLFIVSWGFCAPFTCVLFPLTDPLTLIITLSFSASSVWREDKSQVCKFRGGTH